MDTLESDTELWLATLGTSPLDVRFETDALKPKIIGTFQF
jgi:hypothetical protein